MRAEGLPEGPSPSSKEGEHERKTGLVFVGYTPLGETGPLSAYCYR